MDWMDARVNDGKMGGPGSVVEVDEAMIGRRKYNRGLLVQGTWILGIIDVHTGDLRRESEAPARRPSEHVGLSSVPGKTNVCDR